MNAIKFIKENGVEKAREVVEGAPENSICYDLEHGKHVAYEDTSIAMCFLKIRFIDLSDLKRLVESVDLVKRYGGIAEAKTIHNDEFWCEIAFERLEQAIADYEAIYSDNDMGDDSHIENHISKNCKVIDYE